MKTTKILFTFLVFAVCLGSIIGQEKKIKNQSKTEIKKDTMQTENIVRKGVIDLKAIDNNKDGKVFQDPMDWNVISDKPGKCPLCKMTLVEVTLKKAKENLLKHGFKVK